VTVVGEPMLRNISIMVLMTEGAYYSLPSQLVSHLTMIIKSM